MGATPAPYLPVPEYYEVKPPIPKEQTGAEGQISEGRLAPQEPDGDKDVDDAKGLELSNRGDEIKSGQSVVQSGEDNAVDTITLARHEGYYFGPLLGFAFPDDGAVRDINLGKIPYESDIIVESKSMKLYLNELYKKSFKIEKELIINNKNLKHIK